MFLLLVFRWFHLKHFAKRGPPVADRPQFDDLAGFTVDFLVKSGPDYPDLPILPALFNGPGLALVRAQAAEDRDTRARARTLH